MIQTPEETCVMISFSWSNPEKKNGLLILEEEKEEDEELPELYGNAAVYLYGVLWIP